MTFAPQSSSAADKPALEQAVRTTRIVHGALLLSIALYVWVTIKAAPPLRPVAPSFVAAITIVAAVVGIVALIFRSRMVGPAEETLRLNPQDDTALRRWRAGQIVSTALAEAVVLYGVVLRFTGTEWKIAGLFFAAGAILMLLFTPRHP